MLILETTLAATVVLWLGLAIFWFWNARGAVTLRPKEAEPVAGRWPVVSIIVPARNEEEVLPKALDSLLKLDYPDFEVIVVDDGSTDATGRIADEWAASPIAQARLRVIHNRELPAGWSGKVHALSLAARQATGEWILATDADVVFDRAALRAAMSLALEKNVGLLSVTPQMELDGFWEKVVLPAFALLIFTFYPLRLVNQPESTRAIAAGAFILIRRSDFESLGGYEPIKNAVIEDVRMAEHFKRHGRRIFLALSGGLLQTRMYRSVGEMWEGLSRSAFEGAGFSVTKVLAGVLAGTVLCVLPWVTAFALIVNSAAQGRLFTHGAVLTLALAACVESVLIYLPAVHLSRVSIIYALTLPLAAIFYSGVGLNSMLRSVFGSGVPWKGRRYRPLR